MVRSELLYIDVEVRQHKQGHGKLHTSGHTVYITTYCTSLCVVCPTRYCILHYILYTPHTVSLRTV